MVVNGWSRRGLWAIGFVDGRGSLKRSMPVLQAVMGRVCQKHRPPYISMAMSAGEAKRYQSTIL